MANMALNKHDDEVGIFVLPELLDTRKFILLVMAAQLIVMVLALFEYGLFFNWEGFAKLTVYVQWQVLLSAFILSLARDFINKSPLQRAIAFSYGIMLVISVAVALMAQWLVMPIKFPQADWCEVGRGFAMTAIIGGIALRYLYMQQLLIHQEKAALMASLASLQARIRPHFLFNTMNSITSLIGFAPDKAEAMIEDLCTLLRESLKDESLETTIEKEWGLCERYLSIESLRLGDRLQWEVDFDNLDMNLPIPSLALQPIVENAIYHGIQPSLEQGFIRVKGELLDDEIIICIENSQFESERSQRANKGNKMAIGNIRHRIQQLYGSNAELQLLDQGDTFKTVLKYKPANSRV